MLFFSRILVWEISCVSCVFFARVSYETLLFIFFFQFLFFILFLFSFMLFFSFLFISFLCLSVFLFPRY